MRRRDFFTKGFAAFALLAMPAAIAGSSRPKILNDQDIDEMLRAGKPVINQVIELNNDFYTKDYNNPVIISNHIILHGEFAVERSKGLFMNNFIISKKGVKY